MELVPLGRTNTAVTRLAFGAAGLGNLFTPVGDEEANAALAAAWTAGIRSFDTAPHYGLGLSERRLGRFLQEHPRDGFHLSTKVGRILEPVEPVSGSDAANGFAVPATHTRRWDFTADGIRRSLEESLTRLGVDRVDTVYLHDPDDHLDQALGEAYPALERLRTEGLVGSIGAGMNHCEPLARFVRDTDVDVVLIAGRYTLLDQTALQELLPAALEHDISVVIGGVFNSGLLADPHPDATFDYTTAPAPQVERALRMQEVCARHGVPLRAAAVRFALAHPAVASVLVGARTADEITDAGRQYARRVPAALWVDLRTTALLPDNVPVPEGDH
ncbi:aldo/keto reductase [Streptomyces sp. BE20]|uniref:aldo/keto reductase n=1 Tax=unclassified Streptomyces TaxID=2593676 RepID=UPI002E7993AC|nr:MULTISPECIES: aldo/keto reductase [unclassified Streptomyces]MED7948788.1 aldo/keto reductase [Streptomyces sp. BE303]MEE1821277.1 aldo/keto reductase [Streptomyces sp. BE20]